MQLDNYSDAQIKTRLAEKLPHWQYKNGKLHRQYPCHGWRASVMLFNAIAHIAEAAWHHPEVEVSWSGVVVNLMTHDTQGITDKDFALAEQIECVATWRPDQSSPLEGTPNNEQWRYRETE